MAKLCLLLWGFFFFFRPSAINVRYSLVDNTLTWNFSISFVSSSVTYVYLQIKIQFAQPLWKLAFLFRLAEIIGGKNPVLWRTSNESLCWVQNLHWRQFHSTHTQSNFVIYCNHFSFYRTPLLQVLIEFFELPEDDSIPDDEHFIEIEDTPGILLLMKITLNIPGQWLTVIWVLRNLDFHRIADSHFQGLREVTKHCEILKYKFSFGNFQAQLMAYVVCTCSFLSVLTAKQKIIPLPVILG